MRPQRDFKTPWLSPDNCIEAVQEISGLTLDQLKSKDFSRRTSMYRNLLYYLLYSYSWMTAEELGELMSRDKGTCSRQARRFSQLPDSLLKEAVLAAKRLKSEAINRGSYD